MRIKEKGSKLQLLRVSYSTERGRSVENMVGSIDKHAQSIPEELRKLLQADEIEQLEAFILARLEHDQLESKKRTLDYGAALLAGFRKTLEDPQLQGYLSAEKAAKMWAELDATRTAMRKAGYAKPKPEAAQGE